ncbi:hypothetical protein B296_00016210 [Ensete ventricosum]|uniref:Uncharacterized protein n=1 Tax=Ensete ventricosum TaxID=4639 RepID=A0A426YW79_ENSVE|nr:hypothetical protein B296_00016210 [Ensete ventricosum]
MATLVRRQLPYQGVASPYGLVAPTNAALQSIIPTDGCRPYRLAAAGRPLCRVPWSESVAPLQGALATASRPLASGQPPLQMA